MEQGTEGNSKQALDTIWSIVINGIYLLLFGTLFGLGYLLCGPQIEDSLSRKKYSAKEINKIRAAADARVSKEKQSSNWDRVVEGIHVRTGLHDDKNLSVVISACTSCHSAKLITQNKATRAGWQSMIEWMQATQGLPDLGSSEGVILDYLEKYYAPVETGRRAQLDVASIEWYVLELD